MRAGASPQQIPSLQLFIQAVQEQGARPEQDDALARREQHREWRLDAKGDQSGAVDAANVARIEEKDSIRACNKVARATRFPP